MTDRLLKERMVADAIVGAVCPCGPQKHQRGFPECYIARKAARIAVETLFPLARCDGVGKRPAELVLLDTVPGVEPTGTCPVCSRSMSLTTYRLPEHSN